jgi:hypothetical protein
MHDLRNCPFKSKKLPRRVVVRTLHGLCELALPEEIGLRMLEEREGGTHEVAQLHGGLELLRHRKDKTLEAHLFGSGK